MNDLDLSYWLHLAVYISADVDIVFDEFVFPERNMLTTLPTVSMLQMK